MSAKSVKAATMPIPPANEMTYTACTKTHGYYHDNHHHHYYYYYYHPGTLTGIV